MIACVPRRITRGNQICSGVGIDLGLDARELFAVRCARKAGWGDQPWGVFLLAFGKGALRKGYGSSGLLGKIGGKFHKITLFETDRFVFRTEKMQKRRFSVWLMLVSYGGWQY